MIPHPSNWRGNGIGRLPHGAKRITPDQDDLECKGQGQKNGANICKMPRLNTFNEGDIMPENKENPNRNDGLGAIKHDNLSFNTCQINGKMHISAAELSCISGISIQGVNAALNAYRHQDGQGDTVYQNPDSGMLFADDVATYSLCCQMPGYFDETVQMALLMALDHFRFDPQAVGGES